MSIYKNTDLWRGLCKTGKHQSPVALSSRFAYRREMPGVHLENFGRCDCLEVENNGHSVSVRPYNVCNCGKPKLAGAGLTQDYVLDNLHFHWPSEHTIDGMRFDLEGHFVFYASKYGNLKEALKHPFGITVLGILFVENTCTSSNNFRVIADAVKLLPQRSNVKTLTSKPINFYKFLPFDHETFFTYEGSLTTPDCTEHINWIVYKSTSNIGLLELKDLSHIYDEEYKILTSNNRELQPVNDRTIYLQYIPGLECSI